MSDFIKLVKSLIAKGFATAEEKSKVATLYKELESDEQEVVKDDKDEVEKLPEDVPADSDGDGDDSDDELTDEDAKEFKKMIGETIDKKNKGVLEKVQKLIDDHKSKMERGVGVYSPEVQKDVKRKAVNAFLREGLKSVVDGRESDDYAKTKAEMTTDRTGTPFSGYITDDELSAEIRHLTTEYGVAAREFNTVTVSQNSYKANNLVTDISVYWVDEGAAIRSGQVVLGQESLQVKKLAVIIALTRELLEEQEIDFISFIGSRVAEGFAEAEDEAFFNGDGTSTYGGFTGLLNLSGTNSVTMTASTFASVTPNDLIAMQDATPQGALANGKYYMHRSIMNVIRKLKATDGQYVYQAPSQSGPATVFGMPVVLVEVMPTLSETAADTAFIIFGDLKKATIRGIRGGIIVDRAESGLVRNIANNDDINVFTTDRTAVRWITRTGYIGIIPSAVTILKTATASA